MEQSSHLEELWEFVLPSVLLLFSTIVFHCATPGVEASSAPQCLQYYVWTKYLSMTRQDLSSLWDCVCYSLCQE